ncbi:MAG: hypothetical protein A2Y69_13160 [Candidatus Aminicenantes bacterium RBG_13_59_9]|nr:MAG: hypothetical protein A2Y69_13160 [Candidatus Aminicenantes bacterium RBG_13_59_9]
MNIRNASLRDLAIFISNYLADNQIETILTGGACVSIYTRNKYLSLDLDFVLVSDTRHEQLKVLLKDIGFHQGGRHFRHRETRFLIEFLPPPASVGEEPIRRAAEIKKGTKTLKLLSPTDCVKDRLAAFYHWDDRQSLEQALMVARHNHVDEKDIERWSKAEGKQPQFRFFLKRLKMGIVA